MTRDDAVAEIQEGLGFRTDLADRIVTHLKRVQHLLEQGRTLPWFLREQGVFAVTAGDDVTLPDDFIREVDLERGLHYFTDGSPVWLPKVSYDEGLAEYGNSETGDVSEYYSIHNNMIRLFPRASVDQEFHLEYWKHDEVLTENVENLWLRHAPYVMIGNAGNSIARVLRNPGAAESFTSLATTAWEALFKEGILKEMSGRQYIMGRRA